MYYDNTSAKQRLRIYNVVYIRYSPIWCSGNFCSRCIWCCSIYCYCSHLMWLLLLAFSSLWFLSLSLNLSLQNIWSLHSECSSIRRCRVFCLAPPVIFSHLIARFLSEPTTISIAIILGIFIRWQSFTFEVNAWDFQIFWLIVLPVNENIVNAKVSLYTKTE